MSNSKNNVTLGDMMEKKPRTGSGVTFDATQGVPTTIPTNEDTTVQPTAAAKPKMQAAPVQSGPIDLTSVKPIDVNEILPPTEKAPSQMEINLMNELDAAVAREKKSISARMDALSEKWEEELEAKEIEHDLREVDALATGTTIDRSIDKADEGLFDDEDEDEDEDPIVVEPKKEFRFKQPEVEEVEESTDIDYGNLKVEAEAAHEAVQVITEPAPIIEEEPIVEIDKPEEVVPVTMPNIEVIHTEKPVESRPTIIAGMDDDDLFDDDEPDDSSIDAEARTNSMLEELKKEVKEKITPIRKSLDLSKFTIAQKGISLQKVMRMAVKDNQCIADWVLFSAGRPISATALSGPEILKLNPENSSRNRMNTFRDMYRLVYDHIYDANKPDFEMWLKQVRFVDLPHIYFALYKATFADSNFVNYSCPKCHKVFLKDITFEDMVEYADDETKTKVQNMLKMDTTTPDSETYPVDMVQISDKYVFGMRTPSLWSVIIETASLNDDFLNKYGDMIDLISYIDSIYLIDEENSTLVPVDTKPDPNDQAKTSARRIKAFYDVIKTLSSEDYFALRHTIAEYDTTADKVSYLIPAATCPECATEIPANRDVNPDSMLFTRHQLAAIGNM